VHILNSKKTHLIHNNKLQQQKQAVALLSSLQHFLLLNTNQNQSFYIKKPPFTTISY